MAAKQMTFEQAFSRLEEIANILEEGSATLEETMALFEEANELNKICSQFLDKAESKLKILSVKDGEFIKTEPNDEDLS